MQTDFKPVNLKQANDTLDELISSMEKVQEEHPDLVVKKSFWKRFLGLFRRNPFELPEEYYKNR